MVASEPVPMLPAAITASSASSRSSMPVSAAEEQRELLVEAPTTRKRSAACGCTSRTKSMASPWAMNASHSPASALPKLSSEPPVGTTSILRAPAVSCGAKSASFGPP